MNLKRARLWSLIPILFFGVLASVLLRDRTVYRDGTGDVWLSSTLARTAENWWYDFKLRHRPARDFAPVTVAAIDDASLERFGRWPWSRAVFAEILESLYESGAKSVVFDVVFSEPEYKSRELQKTFEVEVPGRNRSLRDIYKLSRAQVQSLANEVPEIGDQYLGQSIWKHRERTVLGYFWKSSAECRIAQDGELSEEAALAMGYLLRETWLHHVELVLGGALRAGPSQDFADQTFSGPSVGPLQLCPTVNRGAVGSLARHQGHFDASSDEDGIFRKAPLVVPVMLRDESRDGLYFFPSLALTSSLVDSGAKAFALRWRDKKRLRLEGVSLGGDDQKFLIPTMNNGSVAVDFAKRGNQAATAPTLSLARAGYWSDREKTLVRDKIVMIGPTSTGVFDLRPNPVDRQAAGVYLHAAATAQLIETVQSSGAYRGLRFFSLGWQLSVLWVFLGVLALTLLFSRRALVLGAWWPVMLVLLGTDFFLVRYGWMSDFVLIGLSWVLCLATLMLVLYFMEERDRIFLKKAFARYVSPEIVRRIEENPAALKLDGERKEISVLFVDIRGFTAVSEALEPNELRSLLNTYFKPMTEAVQAHSGTIDKFIGDSIMALYGAPLSLHEHAESAVRTAVMMLDSLEKLRQSDERFVTYNLRIGIAVASGMASVGNMGTDQIFNYTALGDVVNVASRLEGLTKYYEVPLLISESTFKKLPPAEASEWRRVDRVRVAGRSNPVEIYDRPASHWKTALDSSAMPAFNAAYKLYLSGDWREARAQFLALAEADMVSAHMARRCELALRDSRAAEWDGVWNFDHK